MVTRVAKTGSKMSESDLSRTNRFHLEPIVLVNGAIDLIAT